MAATLEAPSADDVAEQLAHLRSFSPRWPGACWARAVGLSLDRRFCRGSARWSRCPKGAPKRATFAPFKGVTYRRQCGRGSFVTLGLRTGALDLRSIRAPQAIRAPAPAAGPRRLRATGQVPPASRLARL